MSYFEGIKLTDVIDFDDLIDTANVHITNNTNIFRGGVTEIPDIEDFFDNITLSSINIINNTNIFRGEVINFMEFNYIRHR